MDVESGITEADLSKEKSGLSVEKETTDALATLLANIRNTIPKHGNSDQQRNTFDKVRRF